MLNRRIKYLQIALNSTPYEGEQIIRHLPPNERILIEAGTPLIKEFGADGIRQLRDAWASKLSGYSAPQSVNVPFLNEPIVLTSNPNYKPFIKPDAYVKAYIVADTKCMDRGKREVEIAQKGGASAATVLGAAPLETIDYFIKSCEEVGLDSMVDMIGVEQPIKVMRRLKKMPTVVILHRGVDEEFFDKHKPIPYLQINKIRSSFNVMISIAGGDTIREVQRAIFNDANIVVVWKEFYSPTSNTGTLAEEFLKQIK